MTDYQSDIDIANRALQLVGATRIAAMSDDSKQAAAVSFVYDKLRKAELRRNVWKFSVRKALIRSVDEDTLQAVIPDWAPGSYNAGAVVNRLGTFWVANATTAATPGTAGSAWAIYSGPTTVSLFDAGISYAVGELVYKTGAVDVVYMVAKPGLSSTPPATGWLLTNVTTSPIVLLYPAGGERRFIFKQPASFLRHAPDPKRGSFGALGGPSGNAYSDINFESGYLTASDPYPILLRFGADVVDVTQFDPLFCEGLATRIALGVVEELTQSSTKTNLLASIYKEFMSDARTVNAIEVGPSEPDEDDWITVRT